MTLTVTTETPAEGVTVLRLSGRIDAAAAADFEAILLPRAEDPAVTRIVLEGAGMDYIASAGLRAILRAVKALTARKAKLYGAGLLPSVTSVLKMTGFLPFIELRPTVDECLL